jgi:FtsZ-binding cell division protein ZapB
MMSELASMQGLAARALDQVAQLRIDIDNLQRSNAALVLDNAALRKSSARVDERNTVLQEQLASYGRTAWRGRS